MQNKDQVTYINILNDTLKKKEENLRALTKATETQTALLDAPELDIEAFNKTVDEKDELLVRLEELDTGFMSLYEKVKESLLTDAASYADQIAQTQELVKTQTELSAALQAAEERNRAKLALHMSRGRQRVRDFNVNSKTAAAYYKNMSGKHRDGESYFFNRKK